MRFTPGMGQVEGFGAKFFPSSGRDDIEMNQLRGRVDKEVRQEAGRTVHEYIEPRLQAGAEVNLIISPAYGPGEVCMKFIPCMG